MEERRKKKEEEEEEEEAIERDVVLGLLVRKKVVSVKKRVHYELATMIEVNFSGTGVRSFAIPCKEYECVTFVDHLQKAHGRVMKKGFHMTFQLFVRLLKPSLIMMLLQT